MYKSPIEIIQNQTVTQMEGDIFKAVQSCDINVDKDELIKALAYDRGQYDAGYADGKRDAVKHGRWEIKWNAEFVDPFGETEEIPSAVCPFCGHEEFYVAYDDGWEKPHNYCPNCGAKMDLEEEE